VPTLHADTPALDVLAIVLGTGRASRLYRAVRERKLAATVGAFNYTPTELGVFGVKSEGAPDTAAQAARALWAQVAALREHGVADVEIERAQRIIESRVIRRLEDMEGQATYLAEWEALGGWTLGDDYFDRLMAVTPDDVARVARHYLDPTQASVLVYRPDGVEGMAADTDAMRAWLDGGGVPGHAAATPPATASAARRTAAATFEREEAGVRVYRTPRGVPVLVRRKPGSPMVHISAQALGGAVHEPESHAGLTTLMARTALKGTASRSAQQIAEAGELLGGSVGASVAGEAFGWSISVPARRFSEALELLADVVQDPVFPDDALETERSTALAEVRALRDDMYRYPMRLASRVAFAGHPYGVPASGTEESLARLTLDDVRAWHADAVRRAPSVIGIVGDADPDDLAQHAARAFASLEFTPERAVAAPTWPGAVQVAAETREKAQTALLMLFQGPSRRDDDRFAAGLIATVASGLGGRFFDELRERQSLAYTVHAFSSVHRMAGSFGAYIATSPDREEVARAGLLAEFEKLRQEPVSEDELARAKVYALGTHAIRLQRGSAVLGDMLDAWLNGSLPELEEFEARVRAVTREQMLGVARRCFDPMRRVEGAVRGGGARQPQG
jgi:zinc protease